MAQKLAADGAKLILSARRLNELTRVAGSCKGKTWCCLHSYISCSRRGGRIRSS